MATRKPTPKRRKKRGPRYVKRRSVIECAKKAEDVIQTACIGIAEIISQGESGTVFVQQDDAVCWRITVEKQRAAEA